MLVLNIYSRLKFEIIFPLSNKQNLNLTIIQIGIIYLLKMYDKAYI
jgi:hypothetical protein